MVVVQVLSPAAPVVQVECLSPQRLPTLTPRPDGSFSGGTPPRMQPAGLAAACFEKGRARSRSPRSAAAAKFLSPSPGTIPSPIEQTVNCDKHKRVHQPYRAISSVFEHEHYSIGVLLPLVFKLGTECSHHISSTYMACGADVLVLASAPANRSLPAISSANIYRISLIDTY